MIKNLISNLLSTNYRIPASLRLPHGVSFSSVNKSSRNLAPTARGSNGPLYHIVGRSIKRPHSLWSFLQNDDSGGLLSNKDGDLNDGGTSSNFLRSRTSRSFATFYLRSFFGNLYLPVFSPIACAGITGPYPSFESVGNRGPQRTRQRAVRVCLATDLPTGGVSSVTTMPTRRGICGTIASRRLHTNSSPYPRRSVCPS